MITTSGEDLARLIQVHHIPEINMDFLYTFGNHNLDNGNIIVINQGTTQPSPV
jgi:hypothetical protein